MSRFAAWNINTARTLLRGYGTTPDAVLPMLHALQAHFGYIDPTSVPLLADTVNLSKAEIHGTISFYHDFRTTPPPARVIRLCRAEACQAVGCEALVQLAATHGLTIDHPTDGADIALESVYCLGNCALGPAALIDGALVAHLDAARLTALIKGAPPAAAQAPLP